MPTRRLILALLATLLLSVPAQAAKSPADQAIEKALRVLVGAIRFNKDDVAAKKLAYPEMAALLLGDEGKALSPAARQEFTGLLQTLLRKLSFPRGRELFQYLDAVLYSPSTQVGATYHCRSTVVVHRDLKKQEIPIEWVLIKQGDAYQVVDIISGGDSTLTAVRQEQVLPLLKEGGATALLEAMRKKAAATP